MPLPPVAFHSIYRLAFRWNRHPADVAGWAAAGHLNVVTRIPPVLCGAETVAGMVQVPMPRIHRDCFRRSARATSTRALSASCPLGLRHGSRSRACRGSAGAFLRPARGCR